MGGCSACEHGWREARSGQTRAPTDDATASGRTEAASGDPPAAVSTATNPSKLLLPSEVKVTVIAEAPTLSRAGRSVPLNFLNNKASVPLPWQTVTKS